MSQEIETAAPAAPAAPAATNPAAMLASLSPEMLAALRAMLAPAAPAAPVNLNLPTFAEVQADAEELAALLPPLELDGNSYAWAVEKSNRKEETLYDTKTGQKYAKLSGGNVNLRIGGKAEYNGRPVMINCNITFSGSGKLA